MSDTVHFAEHSVTKKYEGSYGRKRIFAIALYIICPIALLTLMLAIIGAGAFIWFVPLSPTAIFISVKLIYDRIFKTDYTYRIEGGKFTLIETHSGKYKKKLIAFAVSDAELILPYRAPYKDTIDHTKYQKRIEAVSSMKAEDIYAIAVNDGNGIKTLIFIEGISKSVRLLKLYNKSTVSAETKY